MQHCHNNFWNDGLVNFKINFRATPHKALLIVVLLLWVGFFFFFFFFGGGGGFPLFLGLATCTLEKLPYWSRDPFRIFVFEVQELGYLGS